MPSPSWGFCEKITVLSMPSKPDPPPADTWTDRVSGRQASAWFE